jgi:hypothetical protein
MKELVKKILKPLIPQSILNGLAQSQHQKNLEKWKANGYPTPPPHIVKQIAIAEYQEKYHHTILVETGTFRGDMIEAQKKRFKKIISIELAEHLFEKAKRRFKNDKNVILVQGDSGKVLSNVMKEVNEPAIFWLDGHYSAGVTAKGDTECPIFGELDAIFNGKSLNHILLIDDARLFKGKDDYPTIDKVTAYIQNKNSRYQVEVKHDIIRYVVA